MKEFDAVVEGIGDIVESGEVGGWRTGAPFAVDNIVNFLCSLGWTYL